MGSESESVSGEASVARGSAGKGERWTACGTWVNKSRARTVCVVGSGMEGRVRGRGGILVGGGRFLQGQFARPERF